MAALNLPSSTTTVTSYTLGAGTITVADSTVVVSSASFAQPVNVAFYRGQFLLTVHSIVGKPTATTLRTNGVVSGYTDVALLSGDVVVPYVSTGGLQMHQAPPIPGGLPYTPDGPGNHGLAEWSFEPGDWGTLAGSTATNGTQYFAKYIPQGVTTVSSLAVYLGTAGVTPVSGQNFIALYNSAGTRIAVSADQTTAFATAGLITAAMVTPVAVTPGSVYYIGFLNNAGTAAKLTCATAPVTAFNFTGTGATLLYATNGTSKTVTDSSITVASNVVTNALAFFWGVNGAATS